MKRLLKPLLLLNKLKEKERDYRVLFLLVLESTREVQHSIQLNTRPKIP